LTLFRNRNQPLFQEAGILVLSDRLASIFSDAGADYWLSLLREWERIDSLTLPRPVRAVCSRAQSEKALYPEQDSLSKVCLRTPDGQFLVIRASRLSGTSDSIPLAVCFETAKPMDIIPFMVEAYGLSLREKQILDWVLRGCSTKELARSLHISAYTVQDHMKSIFTKTGVSSRRELIWNLFARFSLPNTDKPG
jgi:DNA-binding CsgD family transcriptional regulator